MLTKRTLYIFRIILLYDANRSCEAFKSITPTGERAREQALPQHYVNGILLLA